MSAKRPKLSDFTQQPAQVEASTTPESTPTTASLGPARRKKIKGDVIGMTIRLSRPNWERVHAFARHEGVSLQQLVFEGLSRLLTDKGLPPLDD
ncbi:MAG: hypothetical protein JJ714_11070 [Acidithiobacillus sp.]|nr:hypothetical protein [Acidithiobacillus sp.]